MLVTSFRNPLRNPLYCSILTSQASCISSREFAMAHLTLQEVIDRINSNYYSRRKAVLIPVRVKVESPHTPEFYVPRIARVFLTLFTLLLGT